MNHNTTSHDLNAFQSACPAQRAPMAFRAQLVRCTAKETKNHKTYHECEFADATGTLKLKAWSDSPAQKFCADAQNAESCSGEPSVPVLVEVTGTFSKGDYGVESNDWQARALDVEDRATFFLGPPALRAKQQSDFEFIEGVVACIPDPHFRALCTAFLARHGSGFRRAAAARGNHHARPGGLVEHVAGMMRGALALANAYCGELNASLLLAGVLFHDCGKMWENQYTPDSFAMPFSLEGELIGHITLGASLAGKLWRGCEVAREEPWPTDKLIHLTHLILSHHGTKEWGSPTEPHTLEAHVLHYVDQIDAKLEMLREGRRKTREIAPGIFDRIWPLGTFVPTPAWDATAAQPNATP